MSPIEKNGNRKQKPLLLYSPLDWGLGHTTRSIPLLRELLKQGCKIIVACNSTQKEILEKEIEGLEFTHLEGYGLRYGPNGLSTRMKIVIQINKILTRIKHENRWLSSFLLENSINAVISDNRYGLHNPDVPCILITHQVNVKSGFGSFTDKLLGYFLYRFINKFTVCWVPDFKNENNIAGILSHPVHPPKIPMQYLGCISRFIECNAINILPEKKISTSIDLLILLSGPEPQRTIFENKVVHQLKNINLKVVLVRGLPGNTEVMENSKGFQVFNYLQAEKLNELICRSELVICRSGYTSIMDLLKLRKKMIVVPTPGQAEQEYLASHLSEKKLAIEMQQNKFSISTAQQIAADFEFRFIEENMDQYKNVIKDFASNLNF